MRYSPLYEKWSLTEGIVLVGHDIGECVGDVTTGNDLLRLTRLVGELIEISTTGNGGNDHEYPDCAYP